MPYQSFIGWRFLMSKGTLKSAVWDPVLLARILIPLAVAGGAYGYQAHTGNPQSLLVVLVSVGILTAIVFTLLTFLSVFITVSVFGVILGVASLTVVLAVTSGFQSAFCDKVLGVNAHVLVMKSTPDFANYRDVEEISKKVRHVVAVQPFMFEEMLITRGKGELSGIALKGVDPDRVGTVLDLPKHMMPGKGQVTVLKEEPDAQGRPPVVIGKELAQKPKADVGDEVTLVAPLFGYDMKNWTSSGRPPKTKKFVVRGIFHCGFDEYDRRLVYIGLTQAQEFLEQGDVVRGVEMKLDDVDQAYR